VRLNGPVAEIRRTRAVAAQPQAIWDVLADFGAISSWADNVDHSCLLSPEAHAVGVGTTRRVQVGRNTLVERVTDFGPPSTLAYDVEGFPRWLKVNNRWALAGSGGTTEVTLTTTVDLGANPLATFAERALGWFVAKQSDTLLDGLARQLEVHRD